MSQPANSESTSQRYQFSLAQLLSLVFALCLLFGIVRLIFPDALVALAALLALAVGFGFVIVVAAVVRRNWLAGALVVVALVGILISLFLPAVQSGPHNRRRPPCYNNLRQIGIALHSYYDVYKCFPPAYVADKGGRPMHSWRVLLLPFLDQNELYAQYHFDEPWNGPNNSKLHDRVMAVYHCPGTSANPTRPDDTDTSYVVVVGPHTAFPGERCISLSDITDGTSNSIAVVEAKNSGIHWMEPRDLHVTQMNPRINSKSGQGISSKHKTGANVVMADGSVRFLDAQKLTAEDVQSLLTIDGSEPIDGERGASAP